MKAEPQHTFNMEARGDYERFGSYVLSPGELLRIFRRRLWVMMLVPLVLLGAVIGVGLVKAPRYEASVRILVGEEDGLVAAGPEVVTGLQQSTQTIVEAINNSSLVDAVIQQENLGISSKEFLEKLTVEQIGQTQFIEVSYIDPNPEKAQRVANAVGDVFSEQISEESPSGSAIVVRVWQRADLEEDPVSPNWVNYVLVALGIGTVLGVALAFLAEYLDDSLRSSEEVERTIGAPVFTVIPMFEVPRRKERMKKGSDG